MYRETINAAYGSIDSNVWITILFYKYLVNNGFSKKSDMILKGNTREGILDIDNFFILS